MPELLYVSLDSGNVSDILPWHDNWRCFSYQDPDEHVEGQLLTHFEPCKVRSIMEDMQRRWTDVSDVAAEFII